MPSNTITTTRAIIDYIASMTEGNGVRLQNSNGAMIDVPQQFLQQNEATRLAAINTAMNAAQASPNLSSEEITKYIQKANLDQYTAAEQKAIRRNANMIVQAAREGLQNTPATTPITVNDIESAATPPSELAL